MRREVTLAFEDLQQTVYTATGAVRLSDAPPLRSYRDRPMIAVNGGEHDGDYGEVIDSGEMSELLEDVADYIGCRVVDQTQHDPTRLAWSKRWYDLKTTPPEDRFVLKPSAVLEKVTQQTGIRFTAETQTVRVLTVED